MFKKIAIATLMLGAAMTALPAVGSAETFRDRREDRREVIRHRDYREDFRERERARERRFDRGYYDRFGFWHWYR